MNFIELVVKAFKSFPEINLMWADDWVINMYSDLHKVYEKYKDHL